MISVESGGAKGEWELESGRLRLSGILDDNNILGIRQWGERQIKAGVAEGMSGLIIDLAELESAQSQVLSLLLCWIRSANGKGSDVKIENAPLKLQEVARVSGLDAFLLL
ncbi:MAG: STAS domain-containing protein [Hahellaceae bacterium]|nr:STAS domain-containing protein [Hahellaceae bacterium]MCP5169047.1 STAS domain-containing protein [Hahellaceae bacterium]